MTFDEALAQVGDIVKRYAGKVARFCRDWREDAEQAGRLGVWKAWQSWDAARSSWRTWAGWWIRGEVYRAFHLDHTRSQTRAVGQRHTVSLESVRRDYNDGEATPWEDWLASDASPMDEQAHARRTLRAMRRAVRRGGGRKEGVVKAVEARLFAGASLAEAAAMSGVSRQAVQQATKQRVEQLRVMFAEAS